MCHSFQKTALATALSNVAPSEQVFRSKERNAFPLEALFLQVVSSIYKTERKTLRKKERDNDDE